MGKDKYDNAIDFLTKAVNREVEKRKREDKDTKSAETLILRAAYRGEEPFRDAWCLFQYCTPDGYAVLDEGTKEFGDPLSIKSAKRRAYNKEILKCVMSSDGPRLRLATIYKNDKSGQTIEDWVADLTLDKLSPLAEIQRKIDKILKRK